MLYTVRVKPGSKKGPLVETSSEGETIVYVREKAINGAANKGLVKILAEHFDTAPSRVRIVRGHSARIKKVEIEI